MGEKNIEFRDDININIKTRLPIHPNENESYDLLSNWQGVLSSLHAWKYRLIFLLMRNEGQTKLYLGTVSYQQGTSDGQKFVTITNYMSLG